MPRPYATSLEAKLDRYLDWVDQAKSTPGAKQRFFPMVLAGGVLVAMVVAFAHYAFDLDQKKTALVLALVVFIAFPVAIGILTARRQLRRSLPGGDGERASAAESRK